MAVRHTAAICPLTPAHLLVLGTAQISALVWWWWPAWIWLPPTVMVALLVTAPFFPAWHLFGPWITRGPGPGVALTFDDGPDPNLTPALLDLLARRRVRATFFVVGSRAEAHPDLVRRILDDGHTLGNHSQHHDPMLMLRSTARLGAEIDGCADALARFGVRPLCFRPPVGIVNPRLWPLLLRRGLWAVGFARRAADFGNRRVDRLAEKLLAKVRAGDVLLLHDKLPAADDHRRRDQVLAQVERLLGGLQHRGLCVAPLAEVIGRPVMEAVDDPADPSAVRRFYDALADTYDAEQESAGASPVRDAEKEAIGRRLPDLLECGPTRMSHQLRREAKKSAVDSRISDQRPPEATLTVGEATTSPARIPQESEDRSRRREKAANLQCFSKPQQMAGEKCGPARARPGRRPMPPPRPTAPPGPG